MKTQKSTVFAVLFAILAVFCLLTACEQPADPEPPVPQVVAKPSVTPAWGYYTSAQTVTLATTTEGATIRFTLDGTTPTASSALYSSPITIRETRTLKAIAVKTGWTDSDILTATYTITSPTPTNYTVTFDSNGGSGMVPAAQVTSLGSSITLPDGSGLTKSGYTFGGWNTNSSGTGTNYNAGSSYTVTGTATLYAKWDSASSTYAVIFSANGGSGTAPATQTVNAGSSITLPSGSGLTKSGYIFVGWNTNSSGTGTNYAAGSSYTVTGATFLYAKWEEGSGTQEVTIAMWDSYGDGWNSSAALRINVNGTNFSTNARLTSGGGPGYYTFLVDTDDVVQIYWVSGGMFDYECAFAVYYSNDPPNPAFNPSTGTTDSTRVLLSRQYNPSGAVGNGTLMGSFTVGGTTSLPTKAITSFRFADFSVNATINGPNITVTVPNIVNLTTLVPTIVHNGRSISPASGVAQDFSSPIQYSVTAGDNTTQNYTVTVTVTNTTLATAFAWINNYSGSTRTFTIVARANESIAPVTISKSNTNIILSGGTTEKTISLSSNGSLFTINYGTLTLDNNITLQGRSSNNASLVRLNASSANLVMNSGSKIINNIVTINDNYARGGAVNVDYGTFTMNGGTISGNRVEATSSSSSYSSTYVLAIGGGVYVDGTFIMNNGTISDNTAYSNKFPSAGGGVFVDNYGTFTMKNGTISGNTAQSSSVLAISYTYGGGVAAWTSGTFTMQGGTISGNTVSSADNRLGGGVYVQNDRFTKTGGTIYGSNASPTSLQNTAKDTNSGHAVYASVGSTIMRRNTTAGTSVNMDSSRTGSAGGWE